jgi:hypothetical protein
VFDSFSKSVTRIPSEALLTAVKSFEGNLCIIYTVERGIGSLEEEVLLLVKQTQTRMLILVRQTQSS